MFGKKLLLCIYLLLGQFSFSEFIHGPNFYGGVTIYKELKANWPAFTFWVGNVNGQPYVKHLFDGHLQIFPCGPLKALLVANEGSKELCIYHFINNDGSNIKQKNQGSKSYKNANGRYQAHIEKGVNSLLPRYGINRFDVIVGVDGELFSQPQPRTKNTTDGEYGPIYELAMAIERGQKVGGIRLMVKSSRDAHDKPAHSIAVKLAKLPPFSKNYPSKCKRSAMIESEILNILAKDSEHPKISNNISWGLIGLAMLSSGRQKYLPAIENYAMHICNGMLKGGGATSIVTGHQDSSWKNGFHLIFLAEYFWATGDMTVFPVLQRLAYDANEYHQNSLGGAGHGVHGLGTYWKISFGPPNALNTLGAAMAEKVGAKINSSIHKNYWDLLTSTTLKHIKQKNNSYRFLVNENADYLTDYAHNIIQWAISGSSWYLQNLNTSLASMTLWHSRYPDENVKKLATKLNNTVIYNYKNNAYIHTSPMIGSFFSMMSLNMFNDSRVLDNKIKATFNGPYSKKYASTISTTKDFTAHDAWRKIMNYQKYMLILSRVSKNDYLYFIPRKQNGAGYGGDGYASLQASILYNLLNTVVSDRKNLLIYGNKRRNWLVSRNAKDAKQRSKATMWKIRTYHNIYSTFLLKQVRFLIKGGKDNAKIAKGNKTLRKYYLVMAYQVAKKIISNYRKYPAYRESKKIVAGIINQFGSKKELDLQVKNLKGLEIIDYVTVHHGRRNTQKWMPLRKEVLKFVQTMYSDCQAGAIAKKEYERTLRLEKIDAKIGGEYKIKPGSEFELKARIPRIDINDLKSI